MLIERNGKESTYLGAHVTGGEGGSTTVACDRDDSGGYKLNEVTPNGKVISKNEKGQIQTLAFRDLGRKGVGVWLADGKTNPFVRPGKTLEVQIGPHTLTFEGTSKRGIEFNGQRPIGFTPFIDKIRYPKLY